MVFQCIWLAFQSMMIVIVPSVTSIVFQFVTSCSKPPLLGFAHMEPPFSIRCVQTAEEEVQITSIANIVCGS